MTLKCRFDIESRKYPCRNIAGAFIPWIPWVPGTHDFFEIENRCTQEILFLTGEMQEQSGNPQERGTHP